MVSGNNGVKTSKQYGKPYPGFPLSPHKRGWCKKINGKVRIICGHLPPKDALAIFHQKSAELYGIVTASNEALPLPVAPPLSAPVVVPKAPSLTVVQLKDKYLAHKARQYENGEYSPRSLMTVKEILPKFAESYTGPIDALAPEQFADYRAKLAARYEPNTVTRHVVNIRAMFCWAYRNLIITQPVKWGDSFEKPGAGELRKHRQKVRMRDGKKMFTGEQIRQLLSLADDRMKAGLGSRQISIGVREWTTNRSNRSGTRSSPLPACSRSSRATIPARSRRWPPPRPKPAPRGYRSSSSCSMASTRA